MKQDRDESSGEEEEEDEDEEDEEDPPEDKKDDQPKEVDEKVTKLVETSSENLYAEFEAFNTNTKDFCNKVQELFNTSESKLSSALKENERLNKELETTVERLSDTKKTLEETRRKLTNIKKLLGGM